MTAKESALLRELVAASGVVQQLREDARALGLLDVAAECHRVGEVIANAVGKLCANKQRSVAS